MKIRIAGSINRTADIVVSLCSSPVKPVAGGVSKVVGDIRVVAVGSGGRSGTSPRVAVSVGDPKECTLETLRRAGGAAANWMSTHAVRRAAVDVKGSKPLDSDGAVLAFCEGLSLGAFAFDRHKTKESPSKVEAVDLVVGEGASTLQRALRRCLTITESVNLAREWSHEPANVINPVTLAKRIAKLAAASNLKCTVFDDKQLARMKAEALLSVGVASKTPSRLIVLEHRGTGNGAKGEPVVLVGKAITFDTGGYSLKDKDGIVGMKYDKCGGMSVLGAMKAIAALKLATPVIGIIAAAENMISGEAYRPNDIIKTMSGKTVEIISTDAEGRLVLADALTYAQKKYKPRAIIDLATLTGGVVVALGAVRAGVLANNDDLVGALIASGERVHERLWRLPLDDDYLELIKGDDSDLKNSGGRAAHPVVGGIFLKQFVDDKTPWAHLDIAGTAVCEKDQPYCPKGATGFGVRLLIDYLEHLKDGKS